MIIYEIWKNIDEKTEFEFPSFEEAKHFGILHYNEFYIQPKFKVTDEQYHTYMQIKGGKK